jgi:hypothetical protein
MQVATRPFGHWDVIVIGGGPSGAMAAIAAARQGARTLVVEQHGFLGGSLTAMGVHPMMSFHNCAGERVVGGQAQELVDRLVAMGASPGHVLDAIGFNRTITPFDAEAMKSCLDGMLAEAGGEALYHAMLAGVDLVDGRIRALALATRAGLMEAACGCVIDASGDADVCAMAGVPLVKGRARDGATQPMTMNLKVNGVDTAAVRAYVEAHPEDFWFKDGPEAGLAALRASPRLALGGFQKAWQAAKARGEVDIPRNDVLFFETANPGEVVLNVSRIQGLDATDPMQLSQAEMIGRRQCRQVLAFLRAHAPGFADARPVGTPAQVGVRETRHPQGLHVLQAEELVRETPCPDPIARGGYPIDIHSPDGAETDAVHMRAAARYAIPLRSLLVAAPANLVLAGRAISATHEAAAAIRVTPIAMAIGQAAGVTAALVRTHGAAATVPYGEVRAALLAGGAVLD